MKAAGLVAAAGRSSRMGQSKALLPFDDDDTFVTHLARTFRAAGLDPVVVTVPEPPADAEVVRALEGLPVRAVRNALPEEGLAGSLVTAFELLDDDVDTLVLCPVDMPFASPALVRRLVALVEGDALAAVPVVDEAWGHPVALSRALFDDVRAQEDGGLRRVLFRHQRQVALLPWSDARVLANLNTPADYERLFRGG